jgi:hypothetical protein
MIDPQSALTWRMFVIEPRRVVTTDLPPRTTRRLFSPTSATLILAVTRYFDVDVRQVRAASAGSGRRLEADELTILTG